MLIGKFILRRPALPPVRMPQAWLQTAACLPGKSAQLALCLIWVSAQQGSSKVRLLRSALDRYQVSRDACYDGLRRLESAGLVRVDREAGASPMVTLLDPDGRELVLLVPTSTAVPAPVPVLRQAK